MQILQFTLRSLQHMHHGWNETENDQRWGKILLKVMHYNVALLPKELLIMLLSYFLWKVMHYNVALLPKELLIMLLSYFLWKVMRYNIALLPKK